MEQERFFSGYCFQMDAARMVEVLISDGRLQETDCNYPDCDYRGKCVIGKGITETLKTASEKKD